MKVMKQYCSEAAKTAFLQQRFHIFTFEKLEKCIFLFNHIISILQILNNFEFYKTEIKLMFHTVAMVTTVKHFTVHL